MADEFADDPKDFTQPPSFFPYDEDEEPEFEGELNRQLVEVHFDHIVISETEDSKQYYVLLTDGRRHLMIVIGGYEATAISYGAEGAQTDRPMTHDLLVRCVEALDGEIDRVVIDDLFNKTYFAKVYIKSGKEEFEIDARPSDAIAIAVRLGAPIFAIDGILRD
ncbi:MAG TPA: bifunctional nuclease family protein [Fimbriimonadaceae bacterium]|nr:bifunctional nuclease family protein [Fimbriimonadaceae bacterium]